MITFYLNPSSFFRICKKNISIPKNTKICIDSGIMFRIAKFFNKNFERRCFDLSYGIGDARPLFHMANSNSSVRLLFVGGTVEEAEKFDAIIKENYSLEGKINTISGFSSNLLENILNTIAAQKPTHLIVGLGAPLQEEIAIQVENYYPNLDIRTCGGFISQTAMNKGEFYPKFIQTFGLRWAYRFIKQPYVIKRVIQEYPLGIFYFIKSDL